MPTSGNGSYAFIGSPAADLYDLSRGYGTVDGKGGVDKLIVNYSSLTTGQSSQILADSNPSGYWFDGAIIGGPANAVLSFLNIEQIVATLTAGDDTITVDTAGLLTPSN